MKHIAIITALITLYAAVLQASYVHKTEILGSRCDQWQRSFCKRLARLTNGQCASPLAIDGCRYDSLQHD